MCSSFTFQFFIPKILLQGYNIIVQSSLICTKKPDKGRKRPKGMVYRRIENERFCSI